MWSQIQVDWNIMDAFNFVSYALEAAHSSLFHQPTSLKFVFEQDGGLLRHLWVTSEMLPFPVLEASSETHKLR